MIHPISIRLRITLLLVAAMLLTLETVTLLRDARIDNEVAEQADTHLLKRAQALSDLFRMGLAAGQPTLGTAYMPQFLACDGIVYFNIQCPGTQVPSSPATAGPRWPIQEHHRWTKRACY